MRSLIILEVEHREDTDALTPYIDDIREVADIFGMKVNDYTVRVDLPPCFVLDS